MRIRPLWALAAAAAAVLTLTACSDDPAPARSDVATLRSAPPPTGPSSAAPPAAKERPLLRPDDGPEDYDRLTAVWSGCMRENGVPLDRNGKGGHDAPQATMKAAGEACEHLQPEWWFERERRTNPEYPDLLRAQARCLKAKGHDVTVGGDPVAIMYGDNTSANRAWDDEQACQREAFAAQIEKYER